MVSSFLLRFTAGRIRIIAVASSARPQLHGPPFTIGIEEELMLLDAEASSSRRGSRRSSPSVAEDARGPGQARADAVGARDRDHALRRTSPPPARSCASCARRWPRSPSATGCCWPPSGHPPVRALGGAADRRSPALPRARRRARLDRAPRADLRHPRPRRRRRARQGDLRRRRDAPHLPLLLALSANSPFWRGRGPG